MEVAILGVLAIMSVVMGIVLGRNGRCKGSECPFYQFAKAVCSRRASGQYPFRPQDLLDLGEGGDLDIAGLVQVLGSLMGSKGNGEVNKDG